MLLQTVSTTERCCCWWWWWWWWLWWWCGDGGMSKAIASKSLSWQPVTMSTSVLSSPAVRCIPSLQEGSSTICRNCPVANISRFYARNRQRRDRQWQSSPQKYEMRLADCSVKPNVAYSLLIVNVWPDGWAVQQVKQIRIHALRSDYLKVLIVCNLHIYVNGVSVYRLSFLANVLRYVRYMLSAVRLLSVCLWRWCTILRRLNFSAIFFHHTIAQGLYFSDAKNRWWGTPLSPWNFRTKWPTPFKTAQFRPISAHSASTVIASEKVQLALIASRPRAFQRAIDEPCTLPISPPKGGTKTRYRCLCQ